MKGRKWRNLLFALFLSTSLLASVSPTYLSPTDPSLEECLNGNGTFSLSSDWLLACSLKISLEEKQKSFLVLSSQYSLALEYLRSAKRLSPNSEKVFYYEGRVYQELLPGLGQDLPKSLLALNFLNRLHPDNDETKQLLKLAYLKNKVSDIPVSLKDVEIPFSKKDFSVAPFISFAGGYLGAGVALSSEFVEGILAANLQKAVFSKVTFSANGWELSGKVVNEYLPGIEKPFFGEEASFGYRFFLSKKWNLKVGFYQATNPTQIAADSAIHYETEIFPRYIPFRGMKAEVRVRPQLNFGRAQASAISQMYLPVFHRLNLSFANYLRKNWSPDENYVLYDGVLPFMPMQSLESRKASFIYEKKMGAQWFFADPWVLGFWGATRRTDISPFQFGYGADLSFDFGEASLSWASATLGQWDNASFFEVKTGFNF